MPHPLPPTPQNDLAPTRNYICPLKFFVDFSKVLTLTNGSTMRGNPYLSIRGKMPSKNTSVISARVKDEIALKLGEIADSKGISIAKLIEEMVLESESKKGVTPDGYADRWTSRLENKFEELRERGYPERVIDDLKDQILDGLENQISRMPKNYSSRYFE